MYVASHYITTVDFLRTLRLLRLITRDTYLDTQHRLSRAIFM